MNWPILPDMTFFRTRFSALVVWGMIPLALGAGMPSTGCVCANGHIKLFCGQVLGAAKSHSSPQHESDCKLDCCGSEAALAGADSEGESDCCGGGSCCHGAKAGQAGITSQTCCQPILALPSTAPKIVSAPCDEAPLAIAVAEETGALVRSPFTLDAAEFDTGPPLDRVIVFRSLLI